MRNVYFLYSCVIFSFLSFSIQAQTNSEKTAIIKETNVVELEKFKQQIIDTKNRQQESTATFLRKNNLPQQFNLQDGRTLELQKVINGTPIYYTTFNVDAAVSTRTNFLHSNGALGLNVNGQNMTAHVWDGGLARTTHVEYDGPGGNNRFSIGDTSTTLNFHAAHVTGTIIAYGADPLAKGMAPRANAVGYDWNDDLTEATTAASGGMLVSNHSYGFAVRNPNTGQPWLPDYFFGGYIDDSRDWDNLMYNAPYYLMVVAAGNDGADDTANSNPLEGNAQYDKLTGHSTCKNNLVIANAQDAIINVDGSLSNVVINSSSSEGPTDDLRIKPDLTGNGTGVYSTYETSNTAYNSISGTSMASPNVAGSLVLLQEHYNNINSSFMRAATLKGLALHTADDAGPTGPDAVYGWGLMNTKKAAQAITNNGDKAIISELSLNSGQSYQINVDASGLEALQASISWTDIAGTTTTIANNNTPRLVNDLDIRITQNTDTFTPWRLTGVTTNGTGDNIRDPYERIDIANPSGSYTITVTHKGALSSGSQNFSLIVTGLSSSSPCTATTPTNLTVVDTGALDAYVTWDAAQGATYRVRFRESGTTTWNSVLTNDAEVRLTGLNESTTYDVRVRSICSGGTQSSYSPIVNFTTTALTYCDANGNSQADEFISRVRFSNIDQSSGAETNGYGDYTNVTANVDKGSSYNMEVTTTWTNPANVYPEGYAVYIDYNRDGDFTDSGELAWSLAPNTNSPVSGNITIPNEAITGTTRMRVMMSWNQIANSCGTFGYGEVEDYSINISGSNCSNVSNLNVDTIGTTSLTVSWTENNTPAATAWEVVAVLAGSGAPAPSTTNATTNPFTLTGLSDNTTYDIYVRTDCASSFVSLTNITTRTLFCGTSVSDPGGEGAQHGNNESETYIICPENPGDSIVLNFSEFNLENNGTGCYDGLTIYDGDSVAASVILPPNGGNAWCWDRDDATPNGSGDLLNTSIAASNASGCITLVFSSDGSVIRDGFTASIHCESTVYLWNGISWTNDPEGSITSSNNLYVNDGSTPVINSSIDTKNVFLDDVASIDMNNSNLNIDENLHNHGTISGNGIVVMDGSSAQIIYGNGNIENTNVDNSNGVTINDSVNLSGSLNILNGDLNTNNSLTFKSDLNHTAVFGTMNPGASITGQVNVEQYIPAGNRAFRFIGATVSGASVFDSWQESGNNVAGFGFHVTGMSGTAGNHDATTGLDFSNTGDPSMFTWNSSSQSWNTITNTKSEILTPGQMYRVMIRGDRTTDLTTNSAAVSETTIRATGSLHTGPMNIAPVVSTGAFYTIANPYQAKLDISQVPITNTAMDMYYWDPTLGTRGNYVAVDRMTGNNTAGNSSNVLEPGQAVFLQASAANPTISIDEGHKIAGTSNAGVLRSTTLPEYLKLKLYQSQRFNNNESESDGLYIHFDSNFNNSVDYQDAIKINGLNTNISISKSNNSLSVERRDVPQHNEIIPMNISNYLTNDYTFEIEVSSLQSMDVFLKDNLKNTLTLMNPGVVNYYEFDIDSSDTASIASDRFEFIFQNTTLSNGDVEVLSNLRLYPNPVTEGVLNIDLSNQNISSGEISIYNTLGQKVKTVAFDSAVVRISGLESLSNGVYIININTAEKALTRRFIKK